MSDEIHTTLAIMFCNKPHCVEPQKKNIEEMLLPRKNMKLLVVDVSGNTEVTYPLREWFGQIAPSFGESEYVEEPQENQIPREPLRAENEAAWKRKRWAVAETKNLMNDHRMPGTDLFVVEEDNLHPPRTFKRLREIMRWSPKIGAVTGANYSRNHDYGRGQMVAWKFKINRTFPDPDTAAEMAVSPVRLHEKEFGVEPIGAVGHGGMLVRGELMDGYRFVGASGHSGQHGSDVNHGHHITCVRGYYLMMYWNIKMIHLDYQRGQLQRITSPAYGADYDWYAN